MTVVLSVIIVICGALAGGSAYDLLRESRRRRMLASADRFYGRRHP